MRCAHRHDQPIWDGVARYHDGMPIDVVKREFLDLEMAVFDNLPKRLLGLPARSPGETTMEAFTKTVPFDAAEFLDSPHAVVVFLADAFASGDASEIADALAVADRGGVAMEYRPATTGGY